jgi:hypothetical protein
MRGVLYVTTHEHHLSTHTASYPRKGSSSFMSRTRSELNTGCTSEGYALAVKQSATRPCWCSMKPDSGACSRKVKDSVRLSRKTPKSEAWRRVPSAYSQNAGDSRPSMAAASAIGQRKADP